MTLIKFRQLPFEKTVWSVAKSCAVFYDYNAAKTAVRFWEAPRPFFFFFFYRPRLPQIVEQPLTVVS